MSSPPNPNKLEQGHKVQIIQAIIGALAIIIAGFFGYLSGRSSVVVMLNPPTNPTFSYASTSIASSLNINVLYMAWRGTAQDQEAYLASFDGSKWSTQHSISNIQTSNTPTLALFKSKLYMAWRGIEGDQKIYWASFNGSSWSAQHSIPNIGTSNAPTLAFFKNQNKLYMAWKGAVGDQGIYWASFDGSKWSAQHSIPNIGTSNAPIFDTF